jgi:hypothetical protein
LGDAAGVTAIVGRPWQLVLLRHMTGDLVPEMKRVDGGDEIRRQLRAGIEFDVP